MKNSKKFALAAATVCALALAAERANAVPSLTLFDGVNTITVLDQGVGDSGAAVGQVTFNGALGVWTINVSTGLTKPILGSSTNPHMDLNSVDFSTGAGTLVITFTDTDFNTPLTPGFFSEIGGTQNGGTATIKYDVKQGTNVVTSIGALSGTPFSATASGSGVGSTNYSISQVITIVHTASGTTSFDASMQVPDGGMTAALLGFGLLGVEAVRRKLKA